MTNKINSHSAHVIRLIFEDHETDSCKLGAEPNAFWQRPVDQIALKIIMNFWI